MRKIFFIFFFFFLFLPLTIVQQKAYADIACPSLQVTSAVDDFKGQINPPTILPPDFQGGITLESNTECLPTNPSTLLYPQSIDANPSLYDPPYWLGNATNTERKKIDIGINFLEDRYQNKGDKWILKLCKNNDKTCSNNTDIVGSVNLMFAIPPTPTHPPPTPTLTPIPIPGGFPIAAFLKNQCKYQSGIDDIEVLLTNVRPNTNYQWWWYGESSLVNTDRIIKSTSVALSMTIPKSTTSSKKEGKYTLCFARNPDVPTGIKCTPGAANTLEVQLTTDPPTNVACTSTSPAGTACNPPGTDSTTGQCLDTNCTRSNSGICIPFSAIFPTSVPPLSTPIPPGFPCAHPVGPNETCKAVKTAIGDVATDPAAFIKTIFTVLLSMAGGWATYLIITAGYQLMFSGHEAEKVQEARDKITSAIVGLVFMILSLIILRVIGVDIFQLPTFTK